MKIIFSQIKRNASLCVLALTLMFAFSAQAQVNLTVTYTSGTFDQENGWQLVNATTNSVVACYATATTGANTQSGPVGIGQTARLNVYESFGDGWNGSTIKVSAGAVDLFGPMTWTSGQLTTGTLTCPGSPAGGNNVWSMALNATCTVTCPADITVSTAPGTCEGTFVNVPLPTVGQDCAGAVAGCSTITGPETPLMFDGLGLINTPFTIPGVAPVPAGATCVTEVCGSIVMIADIGGTGFEQTNILDEGGNIIGQNGVSAGDCNINGGTMNYCIPVAAYNAYAADGTLNFTIVTDADIDNICATQTIQANVEVCTACETVVNDYNGFANASDFYDVGTTQVCFTSIDAITGIPVTCCMNVTVQDLEPPVLDCPSNTIIGLDAGECEVVYSFEITATDNCGFPSPTLDVDGGFFGDICNCMFSGASLACGLPGIAQIQEIDVTGFPQSDLAITEGCFVFDQSSWGISNVEVRLYCGAAGLGSPPNIPLNYKNSTPVANSGLVNIPSIGGVNGQCICVPFATPYIYDASVCSGLYLEIWNPLGGHCVANGSTAGTTCNGQSATGFNTYLSTNSCVPAEGYLCSFGFCTIDAFMSLTAEDLGFSPVVPDQTAPPGVNEYASGDALPIGKHCFQYSATDINGNTATCSWCVTVNEFPENKQTTSLACNDQVNVSVDTECAAVITADDILEGGPYGCYDTYFVTLEGIPSNALSGNGGPAVTINAKNIPAFAANGMAGLYKASVTDPDNNNNSCWGYIMLEDKLAPVVECEDVTISCVSSTLPGVPATGSSANGATGMAQWSDGTTGLVATASLPISAPPGAKITDVRAGIQMDHSWVGDLVVTLTSPDGSSVNLLNAQCGSADNVNATFDANGGGNPCSGCASGGTHENCEEPPLYLNCATVNGNIQPSGNFADFTGEAASGLWTVTVRDNVGGDGGCWKTVSLEVDWVVPAATPATATDNCANLTPSYSDVTIDQDCATGIDKIIFRQWATQDAKGNKSNTCVQQITVEAITLAEVPLPAPVVDLPCGSDITPEAIAAYYDNPLTKDNGTTPIIENNEGIVWAYPHYFASGHPQPIPDNGLCGVFADYKDHVINACGAHCHGNKKVLRTWTLLNWCTQEFGDYIQIIKAKDQEAPTMTVNDVTVSTRPWDCTADFMVPEPWELHDNCDIAPGYRVTGPAGVVITPKAGGGYQATGAPKGVHSFFYTAYDCCGNESTYAITVTVQDKVAPVVTTKQDIVVSLTPGGPGADGQAKLFTHHIDNGSFDVCTGVHLEIRRPAGAPQCGNEGNLLPNGTYYNNNVTFNNTTPRFTAGNHPDDNVNDTDGGQFVKFCCEDMTSATVDVNGDGVLDTGYVMVILRAWDDANMSGVYGDEVAGQRDNYNEGWAFVKVEDKLPPIISCPADATIYCDWGIDMSGDFGPGFQNANQANFDKTGAATAYSTCGPIDVFFSDAANLDDCGVGTIIRQFRATTQSKTGPKVVTCQQIITVAPRPSAFTVTPPNPNPLNVGCTLTQADLDRRKPSVSGGACDVIGENVKIDTFLFENGVCKKWRAEYNYFNWCTGEEMGPFYAYFVYEDTQKPVLNDCEDKMFGVNANCQHVLTLTNSASDAGGCTDNGWLKWQVFLDTWGDGTVGHYASSFVSSSTYRNWTAVAGNNPILPGGVTYNNVVYVKYVAPTSAKDTGEVSVTFDAEVIEGKMSNHKVTWKVTDGCHNHTSCSYNIMVADKKAPTPYCVSLSTALMADPDGNGPLSGMVELWARDFDRGSFDNCTPQEDLLFTFYGMSGAFKDTIIRVGNRDYLVNADVPQYFNANGFVDFNGDGVTYPLAKAATVNAYNQGNNQKWVPAYKSSSKVFDCDEYNNQGPNGVAVNMSVWDKKCNTDYCVVYLTLVDNQGACGDSGSRIAGHIGTEAGDDLADVTVTVEGDVNDLTRVQVVSGDYIFGDLPQNVNYEVSAEKDVDYMNGVSTLDLVLIQRHILNIATLDSPYKMIAADVNNDKNIRANDLVELRKMILGVTDKFENNTSWKIVDANEVVPMATPLVYSEIIYVDNLTADVYGKDFMATKVGDVSGNAKANARSNTSEPRSGKTVHLVAMDQQVEAGQTVSVAVTSNNFSEVFGYQFSTELNGLTLSGVRSGAIEMNDNNVALPKADVMTASWNANTLTSVADGEVLFTLDFVAAKSGKLSSMMTMSSSVTKAESYTGAEMNVSDIDLTFRTETGDAAVYALYQNEPNPFKTATTVAFEMAEAGEAVFTLYDVTGKVLLVQTVDAERGMNTVEFKTSELRASGIVYYQIESGEFTATKKMIIIE